MVFSSRIREHPAIKVRASNELSDSRCSAPSRSTTGAPSFRRESNRSGNSSEESDKPINSRFENELSDRYPECLRPEYVVGPVPYAGNGSVAGAGSGRRIGEPVRVSVGRPTAPRPTLGQPAQPTPVVVVVIVMVIVVVVVMAHFVVIELLVLFDEPQVPLEFDEFQDDEDFGD